MQTSYICRQAIYADKLYMQTSYICRQAIICYNKQVNFR